MRHAYAFPRTLSVTEYSALARAIVGQHRIYWNMYAGYTVVCMHIASEAAMREVSVGRICIGVSTVVKGGWGGDTE